MVREGTPKFHSSTKAMNKLAKKTVESTFFESLESN